MKSNILSFITMMLFVLSIQITLSGCSDTKDETIQNMSQELNKCKDDKAELEKKLGQGQSLFEKQNHISIAFCIVFFVFVVIVILLLLLRFYSKKKDEHTKEIKLKENIIKDLEKSILNLEMNMEKLKQSIEEGEKNEVSTLIKQLKSEREAEAQDICKKYNELLK